MKLLKNISEKIKRNYRDNERNVMRRFTQKDETDNFVQHCIAHIRVKREEERIKNMYLRVKKTPAGGKGNISKHSHVRREFCILTIKQGNEIKGGGIYDGKHSSRQCNCTSKKALLIW